MILTLLYMRTPSPHVAGSCRPVVFRWNETGYPPPWRSVTRMEWASIFIPLSRLPMEAVTKSSLMASRDGITQLRRPAASMAFPSAAARWNVSSHPTWDTNPTTRIAPIWLNSRGTSRSIFRLRTRPDDPPSAGDRVAPPPAEAMPRRYPAGPIWTRRQSRTTPAGVAHRRWRRERSAKPPVTRACMRFGTRRRPHGSVPGPISWPWPHGSLTRLRPYPDLRAFDARR